MKWKIRELVYKAFNKYVPKKYNRKFFMWCYGLGEEDMINDITYWNCR
jgi:hypothetical protein